MEREKMARNILLACALILGVFLALKMAPKIVFGKPVRVILTKNREAISTITNARNADFSLMFRVSSVNFPEGPELVHPDRGPLGFQNDFYLDLDTVMLVKKEGSYVISIASDDGFRLFLNNNLVGEYISNRPFTTNAYTVYMKEGTYPFRLEYYQGFGRLGLAAVYQYLGENRTYLIGRNSPNIRFRYPEQ